MTTEGLGRHLGSGWLVQARDGTVRGPYTADRVVQMLRRGEIHLQSPVKLTTWDAFRPLAETSLAEQMNRRGAWTRQRAAIAAAAALLVSVVGWLGGRSLLDRPVPGDVVGRLRAVAADASLLRNGEAITLAAAVPVDLREGDRIAAGTGLDLSLGAGDRARFDAGASGRIAAAKPAAVVIELAAGRLCIDASPRAAGQTFEVRTPFATAGIRGTRFVVDQTPEATEIYVLEGRVAVHPNGRPEAEALVQEGRSVRVAARSAAAPVPAPLPPEGRTRLSRLFDAVWAVDLGGGDASSGRRLDLIGADPAETSAAGPARRTLGAPADEGAASGGASPGAAALPSSRAEPSFVGATGDAAGAAGAAPSAPLDLNAAPIEALRAHPRLGVHARAIVSYRHRRPFRDVVELAHIGVEDPETLRADATAGGAPDAAADAAAIAAYPRVALRTASEAAIAAHLAREGGLAATTAAAISREAVRRRAEGGFADAHDLLRLPSVTPDVFVRIRDLVSVD